MNNTEIPKSQLKKSLTRTKSRLKKSLTRKEYSAFSYCGPLLQECFVNKGAGGED